MNKAENVYLSPSQVALMISSAVVGIGLVYMPNEIIKDGKQDAWISCLIGSIYPIYLIIIASYMCKKFPRDNVLVLSKRCFGNILGSILNLIFILFFLFAVTSELSGFGNVFKAYATSFLNNYQMYATILAVAAYVSYKGLKPLGRLCEVIFYITIIFALIPGAALNHGSILELMPVGGAGLMNIAKASKETAFFYTGAEIAFLIYPFLYNSKKFLKCCLIGIGINTVGYTWITFLTIYYFGIGTAPKFLWPTLVLSDSIHIPIINSFRYIFVSLWALVVLRCISIYYFTISFGLSRVIKKISAETVTICIYPIIFYLSMLYGNVTTRRYYTGVITPYFVIFNLLYVSIIAIMISCKKDDNYEKK